MAGYKAPILRRAFKSKVKAILASWVDETLEDTGETITPWDEADDCAARTYDDCIEDGKNHAIAMKYAKERFWDELRAALDGEISDVFDDLDN